MRNKQLLAAAAMLISTLWGSQGFAAGPNDFFGGNVPGAAQDAMSNAPAVAGDYTDDEKRMQKKYQASVRHAKELVAKGDDMIKRGESKHDKKTAKKGKIIKEIGEKQLAELEANNPFPNRNAKKTASGTTP